MPLMKLARPTLQGMHAASRKPLVIPAHCGRFGLQAHAGRPLPGGKPGHVNAAAITAVQAAAFRFGCGLGTPGAATAAPGFCVHRAQVGTAWARC